MGYRPKFLDIHDSWTLAHKELPQYYLLCFLLIEQDSSDSEPCIATGYLQTNSNKKYGFEPDQIWMLQQHVNGSLQYKRLDQSESVIAWRPVIPRISFDS